MTWAWKRSKETAAVVLQLSGGLRIERPGGLSQKWRGKGKRRKTWLDWGKVLSLQFRHDSTIIDQSRKHDMFSVLSEFMHQRPDAVMIAPH